jgi:hypothetical protein
MEAVEGNRTPLAPSINSLQKAADLPKISERNIVMPSSWSNSKWLWLSLASGMAALTLVLWLALRQPGSLSQSAAYPPKGAVAQRASDTAALLADHENRSLRELCETLRMETDARYIRQRLAERRIDLAAMPKSEAVAAIRRFLDSKADASTHLGFKLASNGLLDEAPTLRTFLLDELGRLDPAAAADYAKTVLVSMDSADEWSVALRNLALGDASADGRAFLQQKIAQLLAYAPWQQNPSVGYLEAFDVAVYLGGTDLLPALSGLVQSQDNPAVAHAAFLALDRLVIDNPAAVLASLEAEPDLMAGRESTRADFFARVDVRDPQQQQILESYLVNPAITAAELQTFAGVFPNANFMISPNLLTQAVTPSHDSLLSRDAQSLAVAQEWLVDPRFAQIAPELQAIVQRLQGYVAQAQQGR